ARGMPLEAAYVASKHAVMGLARAAAAEAAPRNVRVNCVLPGLIETPMLMQLDPTASVEAIRERLSSNVPQGRLGRADELAELVCFLLSDRASHITAQTIAVDGGILGTLTPRQKDHDTQVLSGGAARELPEVDDSAHREGSAVAKHLRRPAQIRAARAVVYGHQPGRAGAGARPRRRYHHSHDRHQRVP